MTRERVIKAMNDYRRECYTEYRRSFLHTLRDKFNYDSYRIFAAEELIEYVNRHNDIPVIEAVENFRDLMDSATMDVNKNYMFGVAFDVASDFLDLVISLYYDE